MAGGKHTERKAPLYDAKAVAIVLVLTVVFIAGYLSGYARAVRVPPKSTAQSAETVPSIVTVEVIPEQVELLSAPAVVEEPPYTAEELEILALIIYQEAGGDIHSDETRLRVGTVFLNRAASDRYPDTFAEVATQYKQYGRLYWTGLVWPERADNPGEAHAVARAYECAKRLLEGYRALPADVVYQAEFPQGTEIVAEASGFYFCR